MSRPATYILPHLRRFRLLDLPVEVRDDILEIHFFGKKLAELSACYRPNPFKRENYRILEVNRQLYQEASAVLDRGAVLHLELDIFEWDPNPGHVVATADVSHQEISKHWSPTTLDILKQWPRFNRTRNFRLCISSAVETGDPLPEYFSDLLFRYCSTTAASLRNCPGMQTLTIHIGSYPEVDLKKSLEPLLDIPNVSKALCFATCINTLHRRYCCCYRNSPMCPGGTDMTDEDRDWWNSVVQSKATLHFVN